jgi:hypothetical protein
VVLAARGFLSRQEVDRTDPQEVTEYLLLEVELLGVDDGLEDPHEVSHDDFSR